MKASAIHEGGQRAANGENKVRKKISPMFQTSSKRTKLGPVLESLQTLPAEELQIIDVGKKLEDLGREQSFVVTYTVLPNISHSGRKLGCMSVGNNFLIQKAYNHVPSFNLHGTLHQSPKIAAQTV